MTYFFKICIFFVILKKYQQLGGLKWSHFPLPVPKYSLQISFFFGQKRMKNQLPVYHSHQYLQHCTGHIKMGSWKGRGNQSNIEFVRDLYCKLPTNSKQLPAFPFEAVPEPNSGLRGERREFYHSATMAPLIKGIFQATRTL